MLEKCKKRNKKGEMGQTAIIVVLAVALIVGVVLFQVIAQEVGKSVNTVTLENVSYTSAAAGETFYITDYKNIAGVVVYNATGSLVPAANYTVTNNVVYNGAEVVQVDVAAVNSYAEEGWNFSGTAQPQTYISNSGGRAMANLIVIFFALAIALVALYPTLKERFF